MAGISAKAFADLVDFVESIADSLSSIETSLADIAGTVVEDELEEEKEIIGAEPVKEDESQTTKTLQRTVEDLAKLRD